MSQSIKILLRALVSALAISAFVANVASAEFFYFKSGSASTSLSGKQHPGTDVFTTDTGTVSCENVTYSGTQSGSEASEVSLTPSYSGCKAFGLLSVPIDVNGCQYRYKADTKVAGDYEGAVAIVCPGENQIAITAPGCTVTVGSQSNLGNITYTNVGSGATSEVTADVNISGLQYREHRPLFGICASDTVATSNGTYKGGTLITGTNGGAHTGLSVGAPPPKEAFKFKSESATTTIAGKQHAANDVITTDAGSWECDEVTYAGSWTGTERTEFSVTPNYSGCKWFGFNVPIDVNGCQFRFVVAEKVGTDYEGKLDTVCPSGKQIEFTAPGCTITFGSQNGLGKVTYTNVGAGATRELTVDINITGRAYEEHRPLFGICANNTVATANGTWVGSLIFTGSSGGAHTGIFVG